MSETRIKSIDEITRLYASWDIKSKALDMLMNQLEQLKLVITVIEDHAEFLNKATNEMTQIEFLMSQLNSNNNGDDDEFFNVLNSDDNTLKIQDLIAGVNALMTLAASLSNNSTDSIDSPVVEEIRKSLNMLKMMSSDSLKVVDTIADKYSKSTKEIHLLNESSSLGILDSTHALDVAQSFKEPSDKAVSSVSLSNQILPEALQVDDVNLDDRPISYFPADDIVYSDTSDKPLPSLPTNNKSMFADSDIIKPLPSIPQEIKKLPDVPQEPILEVEKKYKLKEKQDSIKAEGTITEYDFQSVLDSIDFSASEDPKILGELIFKNCRERQYKTNESFYQQFYVFVKPLDIGIKKKAVLHLICNKAVIGDALMAYAPLCDAMESLKWYVKAAESGNVQAMYTVAEIYYTGKGVDKVTYIAEKWYRAAAKQGDEKSAIILKTILRKKRWRMTWQIILSLIILLIILAVIAWVLGPKSLSL